MSPISLILSYLSYYILKCSSSDIHERTTHHGWQSRQFHLRKTTFMWNVVLRKLRVSHPFLSHTSSSRKQSFLMTDVGLPAVFSTWVFNIPERAEQHLEPTCCRQPLCFGKTDLISPPFVPSLSDFQDYFRLELPLFCLFSGCNTETTKSSQPEFYMFHKYMCIHRALILKRTIIYLLSLEEKSSKFWQLLKKDLWYMRKYISVKKKKKDENFVLENSDYWE